MIKRTLSTTLLKAAKQFPIVTVTGPRQSGKTTLVREVFKHYRYVSLGIPEEMSFSTGLSAERCSRASWSRRWTRTSSTGASSRASTFGAIRQVTR